MIDVLLNYVLINDVLLNYVLINAVLLNYVLLNYVLINDVLLNYVLINDVLLNYVLINAVLLNYVLINAVLLNYILINAVLLNYVLINAVLFYRYFGSAEGSKFVEEASCGNVKRSWVNYGQSRDWTSMEQGQVGWNRDYVYIYLLLLQGEEFLYHATEVKNIWLPMGEIFLFLKVAY